MRRSSTEMFVIVTGLRRERLDLSSRLGLCSFDRPMLDVAHILSHYIPDSNWRDWLGYYGYKYNQKYLINSIGLVNTLFLCQIAKYYENNDLENVNREIYALRNFRLKYGKEI